MNCIVCFQPLAELIYRRQKNNTLHLVGFCNECGWRYMPFIPNLNLKVVSTKDGKLNSKKKKKKKKRKQNQPSLFD